MATYRSRNVTVTVDASKLLKIKGGLAERAHKILDKAAFDIEGTAKQLAPVDTGALRSSIYVSGGSGGTRYEQGRSEATGKAQGRGKNIRFVLEVKAGNPFERVIAPSVVYAGFVEDRKPYLAPAVRVHKMAFLKAWRKVVG